LSAAWCYWNGHVRISRKIASKLQHGVGSLCCKGNIARQGDNSCCHVTIPQYASLVDYDSKRCSVVIKPTHSQNETNEAEQQTMRNDDNTGLGLLLGMIALWAISVLASLGFLGVIIYVAYHFVSKFW